jgi:hypothetical protein
MTHLLLDFDGVVLKNTHTLKHQNMRSLQLVQKHSGFDISYCKKLKQRWRPVYKQTVPLINGLFKKNVSLYEYQDFVFDPRYYTELIKDIDEETVLHMKEYEKLIQHCEKNKIPWHIFTNARIDWVLYFSCIAGIKIKEENIIWALENDFTYLKPYYHSYQKVENMFPETKKFVYADDTYFNLEPVQKKDKWQTIYICNNESTTYNLSKIYEKLLI